MAQNDVSVPQGSSPYIRGAAAPPPFSPGCRVRRLSGIDAFTECLTQASANCKYLFIYGHGRFCTHPLRDQIARQTQEGERAA